MSLSSQFSMRKTCAQMQEMCTSANKTCAQLQAKHVHKCKQNMRTSASKTCAQLQAKHVHKCKQTCTQVQANMHTSASVPIFVATKNTTGLSFSFFFSNWSLSEA
eukprot:GHVS01085375.1.p4 GENE.GHVS01085375.1~~GHVS01085375.1.p4  ORF type:complete len:105 (-),score=7.11 GHVS01085375.1:350-664(-)